MSIICKQKAKPPPCRGMRFHWPNVQLPRWFRFAMPIGMFGLMAYGTWAFSHKLCYDQIYKHYRHESVAIGLICIVCVLYIIIFLIWLQLAVIVGPGKLPHVSPYLIFTHQDYDIEDREKLHSDESVSAPICYQCDPNGWPLWCSNCQGLKTERAHHSRELGYCVPKFDHRCIWLGSIIGKDNYRLFIQFCVFMTIWLAIIWTSIVAYIRNIVRDYKGGGSHLNGNLIAILILTTACWMLITSLFVTQLNCIIKNRTSLEVMEKRRKAFSTRKLFCYYNSEDESRYVVEFTKKEYANCWSKENWWKNAVESLGSNVLMWFIPLGSSVPRFDSKSGNNENGMSSADYIIGPYKERLGDHAIDLIKLKISKSEYLTKLQTCADSQSSR